MIWEIMVSYTFRHRYAKASHAAATQLNIIIATAMVHTTEVHNQSYARLIPDGSAEM